VKVIIAAKISRFTVLENAGSGPITAENFHDCRCEWYPIQDIQTRKYLEKRKVLINQAIYLQ
jgi:hypothetical protein